MKIQLVTIFAFALSTTAFAGISGAERLENLNITLASKLPFLDQASRLSLVDELKTQVSSTCLMLSEETVDLLLTDEISFEEAQMVKEVLSTDC